jgi:hypothetical protein
MSSIYTLPLALDTGVDYSSPAFPWFQADGVTPRSLVGYTARLMLRVTRRDVRPQLAITDAASQKGRVVLANPSPTNGLVTFTLTQYGLAFVRDRSGSWDLLLDSGDATAVTTKLASGTWSLERSVTDGAVSILPITTGAGEVINFYDLSFAGGGGYTASPQGNQFTIPSGIGNSSVSVDATGGDVYMILAPGAVNREKKFITIVGGTGSAFIESALPNLFDLANGSNNPGVKEVSFSGTEQTFEFTWFSLANGGLGGWYT